MCMGTLHFRENKSSDRTYEAIDEDLHPVVQYLGPAEALIHEGNHAFRIFKSRVQYNLDVNTPFVRNVFLDCPRRMLNY